MIKQVYITLEQTYCPILEHILQMKKNFMSLEIFYYQPNIHCFLESHSIY